MKSSKKEKIYLNSASTSLVSPEVFQVMEEFRSVLQDETRSDNDVTLWQRNSLINARRAVAGLINCEPEEVALMQSTSHALGTLVNSLPLKKGDNVLICDLEYQASTVCWQPRQSEIGFEVREVKTTGGRVSAEDFRRSIDQNTKVILIAAVQEINGFRADIKKISELAKEHECVLIVDGIQEVGALKVDVKEMGADIYCAGGKKWLGNPFGMGFMYIRKELLTVLKPPYYSYYDIRVPSKYENYLLYLEDPVRHPFDEYTLSDTASIFETGGYGNYLGAMGLSKAIEVLQKKGIEEIERWNIYLCKKLYHGLESMGLYLGSPSETENMSSIISFNFDKLANNDVEKERRLMKFLRERGIWVSLRCSTGVGGIRVSVHHYTPEYYVDRFLECVREFIDEEQNVL